MVQVCNLRGGQASKCCDAYDCVDVLAGKPRCCRLSVKSSEQLNKILDDALDDLSTELSKNQKKNQKKNKKRRDKLAQQKKGNKISEPLNEDVD